MSYTKLVHLHVSSRNEETVSLQNRVVHAHLCKDGDDVIFRGIQTIVACFVQHGCIDLQKQLLI